MTAGRTLEDHLAASFVGRTDELAALGSALEPSGPAVTFVHGLAGVGTSALLERFGVEARRRGATVHHLDCGAVQPTPAAVLAVLAGGGPDAPVGVDAVARSLAAHGPTVLLLDHWEAFRLLDTWFRLELVPRLGPSVAIVAAGQQPPSVAWRASSDPAAAVRSLTVDVLPRADSLRLLAREGVTGADAERLYRLTRGLPLALRVAAAAATRSARIDVAAVALPDVAAVITAAYLVTLDPQVRVAVEALSVVRRGTASLLAAMLPGSAPGLPGALAQLPFVQTTVDGLALHDAIRVPVAAALEGVDPSRYAAYRQAAWQVVDRELRGARPSDTWRYTADLLYLIDHPLVREAFFPPSAAQQVVEAATGADVDDIATISGDHLVASVARTVAAAVTVAPTRVRVVRSATDPVAGFMVPLERAALTSDPVRRDPLVGAVREHLRRHPVAPSQDVLLLLATLSRAAGEARSDASAALWLDIKRTYLDRRDRLRRVYAIVVDVEGFLATARPLGFTAVGDPVEVDGVTHHVTLLDFGPACVDGWLSWLAGEQVGDRPRALRLQPDTRTARVHDRAVTLSQLEFGLLEHLVRLGGRPVSRGDLIREVWGQDYAGGSNVVDAVVRTLRRKLGPAAHMVEAVRGVGYRYVDDVAPG